MKNSKRERIENLVRSIDHAEERISYWERFNRYGDYDILIRLNISNREPEVVEHEDDIVKQIINNYKRDLERWNKELDELLAPKTTGNEQYVSRNDKVYYWWKKNK